MLTALLLASPLLMQGALGAQDQQLAFELRTLADEYHQLGLFQGTVLVARGDTVLLRAAYGYADVEHAVPNVPGTRFRLASVTKQWTAAAVMRLVESGELELDTRLGEVVAGLPSEPASAGSVTVHQLLSHSAGMIRDIDRFSAKDMGDEFTMSAMIDIVGGASFEFEPGSSWAYSNAGFVMLAAMIESVMGMAYGDAMQSLCFEPLGLADTGHELTGPVLERRARGYQALPDGFANAPFENKSYVTGAGSLYSTVDDLFTWTRALLTGRVISIEALDEMFTVQAGNYGYGWFLGDAIGGFPEAGGARGKVVHHDGGCPGFDTRVILYPEHEVVAIALANARPSSGGVMAAALADMVLGLEVRRPSVTADDQICRLAIRDGTEAARIRWEALQASKAGPDIMPTAAAISGRARRYLDSNQPHKALRIFELIADLYPDDASSWEGLGEAHLAMGDRETAIELYRMAVALDPQLTSTREKLAALGVAD